MRQDGRGPKDLRPIRLSRDFIDHAEGSVLFEQGKTRVIATASVEERVPEFLRGSGKGWVTAEYSMLPRATSTRSTREVSRGRPGGRTHEIQRLIGRSLRAATNLKALGERTVWIDCDVIQADGGTRTASITASCLALHDCFARLLEAGSVSESPLRDCVAAISVGIVGGVSCVDLSYAEDSTADVDMNIVMTGSGHFVEVQGTAEGNVFSGDQLTQMLQLAKGGIEELVAMQRKYFGSR